MITRLTILLILLASPTWAGEFYVSTSGNNNNAGTLTSPWRTIAHAATTMNAGDTAFVRGGQYDETSVSFRKSGSQTQPIKIIAQPGEHPIIRCQNKNDAGQRVYIGHSSGIHTPIGWITIDGFEITNCWDGIKMDGSHHITIVRNWVHDNKKQGVLGFSYALTLAFNIINHNGDFEGCAAGTESCSLWHGAYLRGDDILVFANLIYDNLGFGIQQDCHQTYDPAVHAGPEYRYARNWRVWNNTFAYQRYAAGMVQWGGQCHNSRYENNLFYENKTTNASASSANGFTWTSASGNTGLQYNHNYLYASGSGGLNMFSVGSGSALVEGAQANYTQTGNSVNVANPLFVNGGTNAIPASPDFTLQATSPVFNFGRNVGRPFCGSAPPAGPFDRCDPVVGSGQINGQTATFAIAADFPPIQLTSGATGHDADCVGTGCGTPVVANASVLPGAGTTLSLNITGITGGNCADGQDWDLNSTATMVNSINVGPVGKRVNQAIFPYTGFVLANNCDGAPPTPPGSPYGVYALDGNVTDSSGGNHNGTSQGVTTVPGKFGTALATQVGEDDWIELPGFSGVDPRANSFTIAGLVEIPSGDELAFRAIGGTPTGTNQALHVWRSTGTFRFLVGNTGGVATEFSVPNGGGWCHVCIQVNHATDIATLWINGVAGTQDGKSRIPYTFSSFAGDFRLGRFTGTSLLATGNQTFDRWTTWHVVADCLEDYLATNPPITPPAMPVLTAMQAEYLYTLTAGGAAIPKSGVNAAASMITQGAIAVKGQVTCDPGPCAPYTGKWYYGIGDAEKVPVPNTPTSDGVAFLELINHPRLNAGPAVGPIDGDLDNLDGITHLNADATPTITPSNESSHTMRGLFRVTAPKGTIVKFEIRDQSGLRFGVTPAEQIVEVTGMQANGGF